MEVVEAEARFACSAETGSSSSSSSDEAVDESESEEDEDEEEVDLVFDSDEEEDEPEDGGAGGKGIDTGLLGLVCLSGLAGFTASPGSTDFFIWTAVEYSSSEALFLTGNAFLTFRLVRVSTRVIIALACINILLRPMTMSAVLGI